MLSNTGDAAARTGAYARIRVAEHWQHALGVRDARFQPRCATQFTYFTSTKAQILTHTCAAMLLAMLLAALLELERAKLTLLALLLSLISLLLQKYKY